VHQWSLIRHYKGVGALTMRMVLHFHLIVLDLSLFLVLYDHGSILLKHRLRTWMVNKFSLIMLWKRTNETFRVYYHAVFEEYTILRHDISLLGCWWHVGDLLVVCPLRFSCSMTLATPWFFILSSRRRAHLGLLWCHKLSERNWLHVATVWIMH